MRNFTNLSNQAKHPEELPAAKVKVWSILKRKHNLPACG